jgi:hypothetical protein
LKLAHIKVAITKYITKYLPLEGVQLNRIKFLTKGNHRSEQIEDLEEASRYRWNHTQADNLL